LTEAREFFNVRFLQDDCDFGQSFDSAWVVAYITGLDDASQIGNVNPGQADIKKFPSFCQE